MRTGSGYSSACICGGPPMHGPVGSWCRGGQRKASGQATSVDTRASRRLASDVRGACLDLLDEDADVRSHQTALSPASNIAAAHIRWGRRPELSTITTRRRREDNRRGHAVRRGGKSRGGSRWNKAGAPQLVELYKEGTRVFAEALEGIGDGELDAASRAGGVDGSGGSPSHGGQRDDVGKTDCVASSLRISRRSRATTKRSTRSACSTPSARSRRRSRRSPRRGGRRPTSSTGSTRSSGRGSSDAHVERPLRRQRVAWIYAAHAHDHADKIRRARESAQPRDRSRSPWPTPTKVIRLRLLRAIRDLGV